MNKTSHQLRALTWNIHGCVGIDGRYDIKRTGRVIRDLAPDIAAFQEVDLRRKSGLQTDVYEYLRTQVGNYGHHAWSITDPKGSYGHILVSRFPMTDKKIHDISVPGREPRMILEAIIDFPIGPLRVVATHLGLWYRDKRYQLDKLREILINNNDLPIIMLGDLNEWLGNSVKNKLYDVIEAKTEHRSFPSPLPILRLDRIMCKGGLLLTETRVVREAFKTSDHLPIIATVRIC